MSRARSVIAAVVLTASLFFGIHSIAVFRSIRPPPPPVTTIFGPEYARYQKYRRVETNVGMRDAFALDYVNSFGMPASMGLALGALVLAFFGAWARAVDRCLCAISGVWLVVVFVLSIKFGTAHRAEAPRPADRVINAG